MSKQNTVRAITLQVTQDDIDRGCKNDGWSCPVALAVLRTLGRRYYVTSIAILNDAPDWSKDHRGQNSDRVAWVPRKVADFVCAFDEGAPVEPFSVAFDVAEAK